MHILSSNQITITEMPRVTNINHDVLDQGFRLLFVLSIGHFMDN